MLIAWFYRGAGNWPGLMERATHPVGGDRTLIDRVQDGFSWGRGGETVNENPKVQKDPRSKEEWQRKSAKDRKREWWI